MAAITVPPCNPISFAESTLCDGVSAYLRTPIV